MQPGAARNSTIARFETDGYHSPVQNHLQLGNILLDSPVLLAPMCGYTDQTFRLLVRAFGGTGLAFAEMIDARTVVFGGGKKRETLLASCKDDAPLGYQLCGNDAAMMADAAAWLVANRNAVLIDINMGCPQRRIAGRGAGAGLLRDPEAAARLARAVVEAVPVPVTAKLRIGSSESDPSAAARLAPMLEQVGIAAITVHGRTAHQRYSGIADRHSIREIVRSAPLVPVIGNGDISSPDSAISMIAETGCAGVMIGRAALKRPWIIRDTACALAGRAVPPEPSRETRLDIMLSHFEAFALRHGRAAAVMFRRWIPHYAKTLELDRAKMINLLQITENSALPAALRNAFGRHINPVFGLEETTGGASPARTHPIRSVG